MISTPKKVECNDIGLQMEEEAPILLLEKGRRVGIWKEFLGFCLLICFCYLHRLHEIGCEVICLGKGRGSRASQLKMVGQKQVRLTLIKCACVLEREKVKALKEASIKAYFWAQGFFLTKHLLSLPSFFVLCLPSFPLVILKPSPLKKKLNTFLEF